MERRSALWVMVVTAAVILLSGVLIAGRMPRTETWFPVVVGGWVLVPFLFLGLVAYRLMRR